MAQQSDPEPAAAADPGTTSGAARESEADVRADSAADPQADAGSAEKTEAGSDEKTENESEADEEESAEAKSRRTVSRFLWSCAWLTLLAGAFLLSGMAQTDRTFNGLAWLGAVLVFVCVLLLIAAYVGCALNRITLRTRIVGPVDLFQASTVFVVIAVICGLLVPTNNTSALSLLLPWALTYWIYGLDRAQRPAS